MSSVFDGMAEIFRDTFGDAELFAYTAGATTVLVRGIFRLPAVAVDGGEIQLVDADAEVHFAVADLPAGYGEQDTVIVRDTTYRTKAPMVDGRGMVRIPLAKVA